VIRCTTKQFPVKFLKKGIFKVKLTLQQQLTISAGIVGAATSAFGALNSIMTPTQALIGTVLLGFTSACLGVIGTVVSGIGSQINNVAALPGVERISVNAKATDGIAAAALNPEQSKVGPTTPDVRAALIAKSAS
jgi:hypothetical protein